MRLLSRITSPFKKRRWLKWAMAATPIVLLANCVSVDSDVTHTEVDRLSVSTEINERVYEVSYIVKGNPEGQRVIFVHGTPGSASAWAPALLLTPDDMEFLAIDRPGFGETTPRDAVISLDEHAAALLPLLEERNGLKPILIGHSYGGPVVAAAAANYPDKVGAVIQLAGALDPDLEDVWSVQYFGNTKLVSWLLPSNIRNANRELIGLEKELEALRPKLGHIRHPFTVFHGTEDKAVPYENVAYMQKTITESVAFKVLTFEGVGHGLSGAPSVLMDEIRSLSDLLKNALGVDNKSSGIGELSSGLVY